MGLPIDGTITSFNSKLLTKGFRISPKNKTEGPGARVYRGKFANMPCDLTVQYSTKTNIVFACNAVSDDSDDLISIMETYTKLVDDYEFKYGSKVVKKKYRKATHRRRTFLQYEISSPEGLIVIELRNRTDNPYIQYIRIGYLDYINMKSYLNSKHNVDDL